MSSLKNAVKRKTHKERPQPAHRRRFGLLERKKDYKARADDFHRKEKTLQALRSKAEERNPDEFYFAMERARTRDGVHTKSSTEPNKYSQEQLRLMKGQDIGYLALKMQSESKKVERSKSSLHFIGAPAQNSHTVFVDEEEAVSFRPEEHFDTPAELLGRTYNRPRRPQLTDPAALTGLGRNLNKLERMKSRAYNQLAQREERKEKIGAVVQRMENEKAAMGKGRKRKLKKEGDLLVYKWKQERKR